MSSTSPSQSRAQDPRAYVCADGPTTCYRGRRNRIWSGRRKEKRDDGGKVNRMQFPAPSTPCADFSPIRLWGLNWKRLLGLAAGSSSHCLFISFCLSFFLFLFPLIISFETYFASTTRRSWTGDLVYLFGQLSSLKRYPSVYSRLLARRSNVYSTRSLFRSSELSFNASSGRTGSCSPNKHR